MQSVDELNNARSAHVIRLGMSSGWRQEYK